MVFLCCLLAFCLPLLCRFFVQIEIPISGTTIRSVYFRDRTKIIISLDGVDMAIGKLKNNQGINIQLKNNKHITGHIIEIQNNNSKTSKV